MPTLASATVCIHLYEKPQSGGEPGKEWAKFRGYTADNVKATTPGGEREKKFSVWEGFVNGMQAKWLAQDGEKGTLVCITGTVRITSFANKEGVIKPYGEFTRVTSAVILDHNGAGEGKPAAPEQTAPPVVKKPTAPAPSEEEPPF